jgi:erythromycin esterase
MDFTPWFKSRAIPLLSLEPRSGFADIEPLRSTIGNARIVSLGEATHGTREFFQLKHRLVEYCVSFLGITIFGIEASFPECLAVNEYVQTGSGDAADVLAGTRFWTWNTQEVLELIEWMRWWNTHREPKIVFFGFDMQFPTEAALGLLDYLDKVAPELAKACRIPLAPLTADFAANLFPTLPQSQKDAVFECLDDLNNEFAAREAAWITRAGRLALQIARLHTQVLEQCARLRMDPGDSDIRERSMAENVRTFLQIQGANAKAVLWAHNSHVGRDTYNAKSKVRSMGDYLDEYYGRQYVVVGFAFNQGSFQARRQSNFRLVDHTVPPAPAGSLDATLAAVGLPAFAIDLTRISPGEPIAGWLSSQPATRQVGAVYSEKHTDDYFEKLDLSKTFDILAFVESTTAARPNPLVVRELAKAIETAPDFENLSLTANEAGIPFGWHAVGANGPLAHEIALSSVATPSGHRCVCISRKTAPWRWDDGQLVQQFSAEPWRGKRLRFKAAIRCKAHGYGSGAQLFIQIFRSETDADGSVPRRKAFSSAMLDCHVQSNEWGSYCVASNIPNEADAIRIGVVVSGCATAWFGDFELAEQHDL